MESAEAMQENIEIFDTMRSTLDCICKDPWFSSLWTLQEAFLCPEARFLSLDGHFLVNGPSSGGSLSRMTYICERTRDITEYLLRSFNKDALKELTWLRRCREIQHLVKAKGLAALQSKNPMILYSTAGKRTAQKDYDYIYAIQQVFGFRLGNSRPGHAGRVYSRLKLQMQLGTELLKKYPVQSQMHIFDEPVEDKQGWCMSLASRLPGHKIPQAVTPCVSSLRGHWLADGGCLGHFAGQGCTFADFHDAVVKATDSGGEGTRFAICLDVVQSQPDEPPEYRGWSAGRDRDGSKEHQELASWLNKKYASQRLCVLLLGRLEEGFLGQGTFVAHGGSVGLLLVQTAETIDSNAYWKRIGFAAWEETLHRFIFPWNDFEGLFG